MKPDLHDKLTNRGQSYRIFDHIYRRYDFLNHLFTLGVDFYWRRRLAAALPENECPLVMDLACGTGDVAFSICRNRPDIGRIFGCDRSQNMLRLAESKARRHRRGGRTNFITSDADRLPFGNGTFDAVTMAFGIRNMAEPRHTLVETVRVLKPGGRLLVLEFSLPAGRLLRPLHLFYLRHVIPRVGSWVSRDPEAYRYLNRTIETFPYGEEFCSLLADCGLKNIKNRPLTGGVVTLYSGDV